TSRVATGQSRAPLRRARADVASRCPSPRPAVVWVRHGSARRSATAAGHVARAPSAPPPALFRAPRVAPGDPETRALNAAHALAAGSPAHALAVAKSLHPGHPPLQAPVPKRRYAPASVR